MRSVTLLVARRVIGCCTRWWLFINPPPMMDSCLLPKLTAVVLSHWLANQLANGCQQTKKRWLLTNCHAAQCSSTSSTWVFDAFWVDHCCWCGDNDICWGQSKDKCVTTGANSWLVDPMDVMQTSWPQLTHFVAPHDVVFFAMTKKSLSEWLWVFF